MGKGINEVSIVAFVFIFVVIFAQGLIYSSEIPVWLHFHIKSLHDTKNNSDHIFLHFYRSQYVFVKPVSRYDFHIYWSDNHSDYITYFKKDIVSYVKSIIELFKLHGIKK